MSELPVVSHPNLLVGIETSDDAGVYKLNSDLALVQTLDFFTPIVDDPYHFGRIAAANALSDVYAMGGEPLTAMNIVCFPVTEMPKEILQEILGEERAALGVGGYLLEQCGAYDLVTGSTDLASFVAEREPARNGVNMSRSIGAADGLSHTSYEALLEQLGEPYRSRLVSAEKLVSDFRSRRVMTEVAAFSEAGEISREIAERAFSNEVINPGVTALEEVSSPLARS